MPLDDVDRVIINGGQSGFPLAPRPYAILGARFGLTEEEMLARVRRLHQAGYISRLGPVLHPRRLGGVSTLAAMAVPLSRLEEVISLVNSYRQVSQNYIRTHTYNLWFVVTGEGLVEVDAVLASIETGSGLPVMNLPMIEEYFVGVNFQV